MNPFEAVRNYLANFFKPEKTTIYAAGQEPKYMGPGLGIEQPKSGVYPSVPSAKPQQVTQPAQQPQQGAGFRLSVPSDNGSTFNLPPELAQQIGNVFEPSQQATAAAQVLRHPNQQTRTPQEIARLGENWNRGENPEMITHNIDIPNPDGSVDRGLFRINNNTFNGMQKDPFWRKAMEKRGITSWNDLEDPNKNIQMAYLILARGNWDSQNSQMKSDPKWTQWYAAPLNQR